MLPFSKPAANTVPLPSEDDSRRVFQNILSDLELPQQPAPAQSRYRSSLMVRYYLPRILLAAAVVVLLVLGAVMVATPARLSTVGSETLADGSERISFHVEKPMMLKNVSAMLNDQPLYVAHLDNDYYVDAKENGVLLLETETILGASTSQTVTVADVNIDTEAPHIASHEKDGNEIVIHLTDGDGRGVDWAGIYARAVESGENVPVLAYDEAEGWVRFAFPEASTRLYIPDLGGNTLTALLEPLQH